MNRNKNTLQPIVWILNQDAFPKFRVFVCTSIVWIIQESIQNQAFRVCLENDKNDHIQKDWIRLAWK